MALIDKKSNAAIENLTDYEVVGIENLGLKNENDPYAYKIQKLGKKYLLLQKVALSNQKDMMSSLSGKSRNSLQS